MFLYHGVIGRFDASPKEKQFTHEYNIEAYRLTDLYTNAETEEEALLIREQMSNLNQYYSDKTNHNKSSI